LPAPPDVTEPSIQHVPNTGIPFSKSGGLGCGVGVPTSPGAVGVGEAVGVNVSDGGVGDNFGVAVSVGACVGVAAWVHVGVAAVDVGVGVGLAPTISSGNSLI